MAVRLVSAVEKLIDKGGDKFVEQVRMTAVGNAPVDTGMLAGSISYKKLGIGHYMISTHARGFNGVEYPLRIEFGEPVYATNAKVLHFWAHGNEVYAKSAAASSKSHFAKNTISAYGGKYWGK